MRKRLLLVEDEAAIALPLSFLLEEEGFKVKVVSDGLSALKEFSRKEPDIILLDVMLPEMSGIEVCQRVRLTSDVPIIMLTARGAEIDKVVGLEVGADDYVTKPYSSRELIARIRSVMRRSRPAGVDFEDPEDEVLEVGSVVLDSGRHTVTAGGVEVEMPLKEFQLLRELMRNSGRVVSRTHLLNQVWGADFFGDQRTLDVHVKRLRKRITPEGSETKLISTVRGVGYRFEEA
ncbi:response regulator [Actinomyces minihominis]|uniref:response regulator n=1 Tax=Actinomyces minihominis TaxID=2002838 RepID=UPI000C07468C|nr:response regulator transcription factor [Actinomyces minihominis]